MADRADERRVWALRSRARESERLCSRRAISDRRLSSSDCSWESALTAGGQTGDQRAQSQAPKACQSTIDAIAPWEGPEPSASRDGGLLRLVPLL